MHRVNPTIWQNVNDVENFGFLSNLCSEACFWSPNFNDLIILTKNFAVGTQVQPFHLVTADNVTLYGWHMLPLELYRENEAILNENVSSSPVDDYTATTAFKLLANDPNARVVVNCKFLCVYFIFHLKIHRYTESGTKIFLIKVN
jgi:hypothetical protein